MTIPPSITSPRTDPGPAGGGPLDNAYGLSVHPVQDGVSREATDGSLGVRRRRPLYRRQAVAVSLLEDHGHRVVTCGRHAAPGQEARLVRAEDGSHGFAGLIRCGSVWACPVCRSHIAQHRALEVSEALTNAEGMGLHRTLVTFTARHTPTDDLDPLWRSLRSAYSGTFSGRAARRWLESIGYVGRIAAHEVTTGPSGWHPHVHVVLFSEQPVRKADVWRLWEASADRHGLTVDVNALDVRSVASGDVNAGDVAAYMAKASTASWTLADEMTASAAKGAAGGRTTPFGLLDVVEVTGDAESADRFLEYVSASQGVSSLRWSRGLRDRLNVTADDLSDEDAANETDADVQDVLTFTPSEWTAIHLGGYRVALLEAADRDGIRGAKRVLREAMSSAYGRRRSVVSLPRRGVAISA